MRNGKFHPHLLLLFLGCLASAQAQDKKEDLDPLIKLERVTQSQVKDDPWRTVPFPSFRGRVAYISDAKSPPFGETLIVRQVGAKGAPDTQIYGVDRGGPFGTIVTPQFSPDGRFILFKFGGPGATYADYDLYVLDLQTGVLKRVDNPKTGVGYGPMFLEVQWSPDGNYLSWIENADIEGVRVDTAQSIQLRVCDWRTGKSRIVASNDEALNSFSWTWAPPHTLLWSASKTFVVSKRKSATRYTRTRSFVYEADAQKGAPHLLLRDAYKPLVSPNGRKVAFFVTRTDSLKKRKKNGSQNTEVLCAASCDGSHRIAFRVQLGVSSTFNSTLLWQKDSVHLLWLQDTDDSRVKINQLDVKHHTLRALATHNLEPHSYYADQPDFHMMSMSRDDRTLFLSTLQIIGDNKKENMYIERASAVALDLATSKTTPIAQVITSWGIDWHEDAPSATR